MVTKVTFVSNVIHLKLEVYFFQYMIYIHYRNFSRVNILLVARHFIHFLCDFVKGIGEVYNHFVFILELQLCVVSVFHMVLNHVKKVDYSPVLSVLCR